MCKAMKLRVKDKTKNLSLIYTVFSANYVELTKELWAKPGMSENSKWMLRR